MLGVTGGNKLHEVIKDKGNFFKAFLANVEKMID